MKLRQNRNVQLKTKLSGTLRSWLPILQSGIEELEERLREYEKENPYMQVKSGFEEQFGTPPAARSVRRAESTSSTEVIEALTLHQSSLYETLHEQVNAPLFPTPQSEKIAYAIIEEINGEGYFEGSVEEIGRRLGVDADMVERIRERFAYLEPPGVGARDTAEAMLFQLRQSDVKEPIYSLVSRMLENFDSIGRFKDEEGYEEALRVIRTFKNPPAIESMDSSMQVIPDIVITSSREGIEVKINDAFYPDIIIEQREADHPFIRRKVKEARDLIDALQMRKATLYKIGLMIVEFQYDFFQGGDIRPMKLKDIADEFDHNPSTISRAIANKYLMCDRGIFPMKAFFASAVDEDVSNSAIKQFISEAIAAEDRNKPLSDNKLLEMIEKRFGVKMVRRTVTKYRKQMQIGGSSERKRFYKLA
ncbi:RNA polymerase sigma-54 factor RpoN [Hydrogenimonas sp.]|nr:RNA polymerase sigma-54 factor RpoN [Hydrogenimonas sp.]